MSMLKQSGRDKEAGMVAIMVTLILMIVISLIVLGFAQISRRNQRQALDRQLSTQAFYAAETGVNDATELIKTALGSGTAIAEKTDCASTGGGFYATLNPTIDAASNVAYTCLTVDPTPSTLVYSSVGTTSTVVPLIAESGTISSIRLNWYSTDGTANPETNCPVGTPGVGVFTKTDLWTCGYGILRFDLVPTAGSSLSLSGLQDNTMTSFIVPLRPSGVGAVSSINYASSGNNSRNLVLCYDKDTGCTLTINFPSPQSQYYMRISSIYKDVSLQISASNGASPVSLQGAQGLIDVTGKAEDVLRRIQVRVPLINSSTNLLSDYAIQSGEAICKRFSVMDGFFSNEADDAVPSVVGSTTNSLCLP